MRIPARNIAARVLIPIGLVLLAAVHSAVAQQANLTVDQIMQDPKTLIGGWPSAPFWTDSGDTL